VFVFVNRNNSYSQRNKYDIEVVLLITHTLTLCFRNITKQRNVYHNETDKLLDCRFFCLLVCTLSWTAALLLIVITMCAINFSANILYGCSPRRRRAGCIDDDFNHFYVILHFSDADTDAMVQIYINFLLFLI